MWFAYCWLFFFVELSFNQQERIKKEGYGSKSRWDEAVSKTHEIAEYNLRFCVFCQVHTHTHHNFSMLVVEWGAATICWTPLSSSIGWKVLITWWYAQLLMASLMPERRCKQFFLVACWSRTTCKLCISHVLHGVSFLSCYIFRVCSTEIIPNWLWHISPMQRRALLILHHNGSLNCCTKKWFSVIAAP